MANLDIELDARPMSFSPAASRPESTADSAGLSSNDRYQVMIKYLCKRIKANGWFSASSGGSGFPFSENEWKGVLLRNGRRSYVVRPENIPSVYLEAVQELNVEVAFTMKNDTTEALLDSLEEDQDCLVFPNGSRYQIVDSIEDIVTGFGGRVKRFQYCCLVRNERFVLVWHDDISQIMEHAEMLEENFVSLMWGSSVPRLFKGTRASSIMLDGTESIMGVKEPIIVTTEVFDEEKGTAGPESIDRPRVYNSALSQGLAVALLVVLLLGGQISALLYESMLDGTYLRFATLACTPVFFAFGLGFFTNLWGGLFQIFGPITSVRSNSRFYSAIAPSLKSAMQQGFEPEHVTIQMPVYKESLEKVIKPTVTSLKAAISQYELQGGTAQIFVNDDGLQLLPEDEAAARMDFYRDNSIGWVARPPAGKDGFVRAGKFKKASNMNFALNIANQTEDALIELVQAKSASQGAISDTEAEMLYNEALQRTLLKNPLAWADGNIRIGRYILIVDSDTRVPPDCLIYGAAEMFLNPEVAIIQHSTGVMQVVGDYFENGIAYFTNVVYSAIRFAVGSGEVAPFVGHNAFLRYAAVQSVAVKQEDGKDMFWSESHVSEDFDIALRLQVQGNIVRLAAYHGPEFKEGVSLTIYDELARWQKYAYGCNELVFHPLYKWIYKGPFTPLFLKFLFSGMQASSKLSIFGYIATYYAMAASLPLTVVNYFLVGWFASKIDHFYLESWKILLSVIAIFSVLGPIGLATIRYRLGEKGFFSAILENVKWLPMFTVFFGGISFHLVCALLAHALSINMEWGATAKEATKSNFFKEIPKILNRFKWMYLVVVPMFAGMIYLACFAPHGWTITRINAIFPLALTLSSHMILPFVLNPSLMIFNY